MRRVHAHQARLPLGRVGQQVARDVARRQAMPAQAGEHQVREVLAHAAALVEHFIHRGAHRGGTGVELEVGVDALHQVGHRLEPVAAGRERLQRVHARAFGQRHERGRFGHARRDQPVELRLLAHLVTHTFPRGERCGVGHRPFAHLHAAVHAHTQHAVRAVQAEMGDAVAEAVGRFVALVGRWVDLNGTGEQLLPGQRARCEAGELPGLRNRRRIHVARLVFHGISLRGRHASGHQ